LLLEWVLHFEIIYIERENINNSQIIVSQNYTLWLDQACSQVLSSCDFFPVQFIWVVLVYAC
jgi:hypothetical protein